MKENKPPQGIDASRTPLIDARGLRFGYAPDRPVVQGASLEIFSGTLNALIGANGSGKSTLIRLLVGLMAPQGGEVWFAGTPMHAIPRNTNASRFDSIAGAP